MSIKIISVKVEPETSPLESGFEVTLKYEPQDSDLLAGGAPLILWSLKYVVDLVHAQIPLALECKAIRQGLDTIKLVVPSVPAEHI